MAQGAPALPEASQGAPARPGVQQPRPRRSLRGRRAAHHPRSRFRWRSPTTLHPQAARSRTGYVTSATCSGCTPRSSLRSRTRSKRRGHLPAISLPPPCHFPTISPPSPHRRPTISPLSPRHPHTACTRSPRHLAGAARRRAQRHRAVPQHLQDWSRAAATAAHILRQVRCAWA